MAFEDRNFRSYYYEKFGFKSVEEKKSVEILLKEQPVNMDKLKQFCIRFPLPAVHRLFVWKLLLGIVPALQEPHVFVQQQREQQYSDMKHGLLIIQRVAQDDPPQLLLLKLFLLEQGLLPFQDSELMVWEENRHFAAIAGAVCQVIDAEVDQYWVASRFFQHVRKHREAFVHYPEITVRCLKTEDVELWEHVVQHALLTALPLKDWFSSCFAQVLPSICVQRIWDKMIGGAIYVMVYVVVGIFISLKRPLLSMKSSDDMIHYLTHIPDDCGDRIVNETLRLWVKNGSCLLIAKSDSPAIDKGKG